MQPAGIPPRKQETPHGCRAGSSDRSPRRAASSRAGLAYPNPLASNPDGLRFPGTVQNAAGDAVEVACPKATRLALALMNCNAVHGGAACHWGGPSAFAETMSAIHGIMFAGEGDWRERFNFANDAGHAENGVYALKANYGYAGVSYDELKASARCPAA